MTSPIEIVDYDPRWPVEYEAEKGRIVGLIGHMITAIEHVGSTAVPGLGAKPIIDVMAAVRRIHDFGQAIEPLESIGYEYRPEYEELIPERRYFRKGTPASHHLHIVEPTTDFWKDHLLFRDFLRAHPETAGQYQAFKRDLAAKLGSDRFAFTEAKTEFIEPVMVRARLAFGRTKVSQRPPRPVDPESTPIPIPRSMYVHDDVTEEVRRRHGAGSAASQLTLELMELLRRDRRRVTVLDVAQQIELLRSRGDHEPFSMAVGIGPAGQRVAQQVNDRTGWFPATRRVDVAREEDGLGRYSVVSTVAEPLSAQLEGLDDCASVAIVDDTVFSGVTMRTVLGTLPSEVLARTQAFCLRGVSDSLPSITALCPISVGSSARGRLLQDVSFINASGLVTRVGIRRAGRPPMAFFAPALGPSLVSGLRGRGIGALSEAKSSPGVRLS